MLFCQRNHFFFCKAKISTHLTWLHHRIFYEIVECRLSLILFNGKDASHIHSRNSLYGSDILEHTAEPVHISVHGLWLVGIHAAWCVPFVDDDDETLARIACHTQQKVHQVIVALLRDIGISSCNILLYPFLYFAHHVTTIISRREASHVKINDGIFVQMLFKRWVAGNLQIFEKATGVARVIVVGLEHFRRQCFTEASATGDAAEALPSE